MKFSFPEKIKRNGLAYCHDKKQNLFKRGVLAVKFGGAKPNDRTYYAKCTSNTGES